jgi:hypothetical protein
VLKLVLELVDRQFKTTRSRVVGWTLIVMTPFLLLGWATERTLASTLLGLGIGPIVAGLFIGFAVLTKVGSSVTGQVLTSSRHPSCSLVMQGSCLASLDCLC